MNIVFDVLVDGKRQETLRPDKLKLNELRYYVKSEAARLIQKYGSNVALSRRFEY